MNRYVNSACALRLYAVISRRYECAGGSLVESPCERRRCGAGVFTKNKNEINYTFIIMEGGGVTVHDVPADHMLQGE
jgi:hypothetical protein